MTTENIFWYASTDDITYVYKLTRNAIYIRASRDNWRRIRRNGHTLYHWEDVAESMRQLDKTDTP